jgi:hypothetical protein
VYVLENYLPGRISMTTQKRAVLAICIISFVRQLYMVTNTTIAYIINSYAGRESPLTVQQLVSMPAIFGLIMSFLIGPIAMKANKKMLTLITVGMVLAYCGLFAIIGHKGPFIDPLVMALSAMNNALAGFAESVREIRKKHPDVKFTSGLSNISYGMPARKYINRGFLAFALEAGMDSAIMDPTGKEMYAALLAAEVLLGRDKRCQNYNRAYRSGRL